MKEKKISLSTFFLILSIIVIIVMAIFIYKLHNEKLEVSKKSAQLELQVSNLNETINNLQGKLNTISETINSNNSSKNTNTSNSNSTLFTENQVKTALSNYLELQAHANCDALLENLTDKGLLNYDSSKDTIYDDGTVLTSIKFLDYKNAMLNYVSESEFEKNWASTQHFNEDSNGYLTKLQGGGGLCVYTINSITQTSNSTYFAKTTATLVDFDNSNEDENFTFTIKSYNEQCIIDSLE